MPGAAELPDYYAILGLDHRATKSQIRTAYRLLAKRHHPDLNPDDVEASKRSRELNAAHEVLSDPARRKAYDDEMGVAPEVREPTAKLERNIKHDVSLRIDELLRGTSLQVQVRDPGNPSDIEVYELEIPEHTAAGASFRIPRAAPFDGGWVIVRVKAQSNGRFKVRGSDLKTDLRISAQRATNGGGEMIPSPTSGALRITIPAGIGRGAVIRVPGEGLPKARGGRGDLLVRVTYRPEVRITRSFGR